MQSEAELALLPALPPAQFQDWVESELNVEPGSAHVVDPRTYDELHQACRDAGATATWRGYRCALLCLRTLPVHTLHVYTLSLCAHLHCAHTLTVRSRVEGLQCRCFKCASCLRAVLLHVVLLQCPKRVTQPLPRQVCCGDCAVGVVFSWRGVQLAERSSSSQADRSAL